MAVGGASHGYQVVHGDAGAFDATVLTIEGQGGADGEAPTWQQTHAARAAAAAAAGHTDDTHVVEALKAEQRVFARRIRARVRQEADGAAPAPLRRRGLCP